MTCLGHRKPRQADQRSPAGESKLGIAFHRARASGPEDLGPRVGGAQREVWHPGVVRVAAAAGHGDPAGGLGTLERDDNP